MRFLDSTGDNAITSLNLGNVDSPGESDEVAFIVENVGDKIAQEVVLSIEQVGDNDGDDFALTSQDSGGSPVNFDTIDINIGDIAVLGQVKIWTKADLPAGITASRNPRRYNLAANGFTL